MKKNYIFFLLISINFSVFSQTLGSENFDALTIGNFGTDITGGTAGQGGFFIISENGTAPTTTTNASANNLQVVSSGNNSTQGAQITTPNGDAGISILADVINTDWAGRTIGNNIIEVEFSFFTGTITTSRAPFRSVILGDDSGTNVTVSGLQFDPQTRELFALARLNNMGTVGFFSLNLGASNTDLILDNNTWYSLGYSYDTTNGELRWKTRNNTTSVETSGAFTNVAFIIPNLSPLQISFLSFGTSGSAGPPVVPANSSSTNYVFDDYLFRASSSDTLLSIESSTEIDFGISLYPNPASNFVNINGLPLNNSGFSVSIFSVTGQKVLEIQDEELIDISSLNSGIYMVKITSDGNQTTKKLIKN